MSIESQGPADAPLRVAVIGSGPAGFYVVQHLLAAQVERGVAVDVFDRLATPFGLVRFGVAPDHAKIKSVTAVYHKLACRPECRFFGNVEYGRDLTLADLSEHYHQIVFCTGAQTDRSLGVPGEQLPGSHSATEFVAWYNGHPDFRDLEFDLSCESAVVVGVGNVAVDVARILCRTPEELVKTDIADYALEALRESRVRHVTLLGRRGPAQAAFTNPEVKELGQLADCRARALAHEVALDPLSREATEQSGDRATRRKLEILESFTGEATDLRDRSLTLRFLVSPTEILEGDDGRVSAVRLVRNVLTAGKGDKLSARATDKHETLDAGLVFRSVGYRGVALPDLPFNDSWGVVPNEAGRIVLDGTPLDGLYVGGWIKRGPSGVIGTNKPDAGETVRSMLSDLADGRTCRPASTDPASIDTLLAARGVRFVSYDDWQILDAKELADGAACGRPRLKITRHQDFLSALDG